MDDRTESLILHFVTEDDLPEVARTCPSGCSATAPASERKPGPDLRQIQKKDTDSKKHKTRRLIQWKS